ncbi:hypothetical protein BMS3Abin16_00781 [archaeon BMS3Abin16]|nr:hypothetical protein BMS3Abin16_00781 [archaeon BMS3Abin16]
MIGKIWAYFKKHLTGTKTPSNERLSFAMFFWIISMILAAFLGHYIGGYLDEQSKRPDIDFQMGTFDKDDLGFYFPLKISNIGEKPLHDIKISYQNCYMENERVYESSSLPISNTEIFKLRDEKTNKYYLKKPLNPDLPLNVSFCLIRSYVYNSSALYVPDQNCSIFFGGLCEYKAEITSDEINKTFSQKFFSPFEVAYKIDSNNEIEVKNKSLLEETSPIEFVSFTPYELEALEKGEIPKNSVKFSPTQPMNLIAESEKYGPPLNVTITFLGIIGIK